MDFVIGPGLLIGFSGGDFGPQLRSRMQFMNRLQAIKCQMRVNLCRRDVGMAEYRLNGTQVGAAFHHVRGATVAEHVRTGGASGGFGSGLNQLPDALARKRTRAASDEDIGRVFAVRNART